jgi:hypothetical protein
MYRALRRRVNRRRGEALDLQLGTHQAWLTIYIDNVRHAPCGMCVCVGHDIALTR